MRIYKPKIFSPIGKIENKGSENPNKCAKITPLADPWVNPYIYKSPGDYAKIDISSYGADGRSGESDEYSDITNWQ